MEILALILVVILCLYVSYQAYKLISWLDTQSKATIKKQESIIEAYKINSNRTDAELDELFKCKVIDD